MYIIFEVCKWLFFICSIFVALIYALWRSIMDEATYHMALMIILPWYLLLAWLMVWYILANIQASKYEQYPDYLRNVYKRGLVIGLVVGVVFVALYLWLSYWWIIVI